MAAAAIAIGALVVTAVPAMPGMAVIPITVGKTEGDAADVDSNQARGLRVPGFGTIAVVAVAARHGVVIAVIVAVSVIALVWVAHGDGHIRSIVATILRDCRACAQRNGGRRGEQDAHLVQHNGLPWSVAARSSETERRGLGAAPIALPRRHNIRTGCSFLHLVRIRPLATR